MSSLSSASSTAAAAAGLPPRARSVSELDWPAERKHKLPQLHTQHDARGTQGASSHPTAAGTAAKLTTADSSSSSLALNQLLWHSKRSSAPQTGKARSTVVQAVDSTNQLVHTRFHQAPISCFVVGGEKRLCFSQLINAVMPESSLADIQQAVARLGINLSACNASQLQTLKANALILPHADSCGLITNSDSERLVRLIQHWHKQKREAADTHARACRSVSVSSECCRTESRGSEPEVADEGQTTEPSAKAPAEPETAADTEAPPSLEKQEPRSNTNDERNNSAAEEELQLRLSPACSTPPATIQVAHDCFGGCAGRASAADYVVSTSTCITCSTCDAAFAPDEFVCHSHVYSSERHTCHWGFEQSHWRAYLHLTDAVKDHVPSQEALKLFKAKHAASASSTSEKAQQQQPTMPLPVKPQPTTSECSSSLSLASPPAKRRAPPPVARVAPAFPMATAEGKALATAAGSSSGGQFDSAALIRHYCNALLAQQQQGGKASSMTAADGLLALAGSSSYKQQQQPLNAFVSLPLKPADTCGPSSHQQQQQQLQQQQQQLQKQLQQQQQKQQQKQQQFYGDTAKPQPTDALPTAECTLAELLDVFVANGYGRRLIDAKLTHVQSQWDAQLETLHLHNRMLTQELHNLRSTVVAAFPALLNTSDTSAGLARLPLL